MKYILTESEVIDIRRSIKPVDYTVVFPDTMAFARAIEDAVLARLGNPREFGPDLSEENDY